MLLFMSGLRILCLGIAVVLSGCQAWRSAPIALEPATGSSEYVKVGSRYIIAVRHDPVKEDLYLRFRDGNEVVYHHVPYKEVEQFLRVEPGMGGYWRANIRYAYAYDVVRKDEDSKGQIVTYEVGLNKGR